MCSDLRQQQNTVERNMTTEGTWGNKDRTFLLVLNTFEHKMHFREQQILTLRFSLKDDWHNSLIIKTVAHKFSATGLIDKQSKHFSSNIFRVQKSRKYTGRHQLDDCMLLHWVAFRGNRFAQHQENTTINKLCHLRSTCELVMLLSQPYYLCWPSYQNDKCLSGIRHPSKRASRDVWSCIVRASVWLLAAACVVPLLRSRRGIRGHTAAAADGLIMPKLLLHRPFSLAPTTPSSHSLHSHFQSIPSPFTCLLPCSELFLSSSWYKTFPPSPSSVLTALLFRG